MARAGVWFLPLSGLGEPEPSPSCSLSQWGGYILVLTDKAAEAFPRKQTPQARRRTESQKHLALCIKKQTESKRDSRQS